MKKTKYLVSLFLLMCILGGSFAHAAGSGAMKLAQVSEKNTAQLTYLRTQPNDNASVTFGYNKGVFLMILSEDANGWCYVSIGNQEGYIKKTELSTDNVTSAKAGYLVSVVHPTPMDLYTSPFDKPSSSKVKPSEDTTKALNLMASFITQQNEKGN